MINSPESTESKALEISIVIPIYNERENLTLLDEKITKCIKPLNKEYEVPFERFNLGTGNGYSVMEIIKMFENVSQKKLNYQITGRRDGDTPVLYASTDVAEQKLKWKAQRSLEEMISSSWQWEQNYRTD